MKKPWREAASLIIAAKTSYNSPTTSTAQNTFDYKVLALKRHRKSNFMPNAYVFPGGEIDKNDSFNKWYELYNSFGIKRESFKLLVQNQKNDLDILQSKGDELPREISLRISAIRECFEESGILFCKSKDNEWRSSFNRNEQNEWRRKVHENAEEFLSMCQQWNIYPDLWALDTWSNWLTPTVFPPAQRFNTIFFITLLPNIPEANYQDAEMEDLIWTTPEEALSSQTIFVGIPQFYEFSKLLPLKKLSNLQDYINSRKSSGQLPFYIPVTVKLLDGMAQLFPGDSLYPEKVDFVNKQVIDHSSLSIKDFRKVGGVLHRVERFNDNQETFTLQNNTLDHHKNSKI